VKAVLALLDANRRFFMQRFKTDWAVFIVRDDTWEDIHNAGCQ
jgi:hypothetical protein